MKNNKLTFLQYSCIKFNNTTILNQTSNNINFPCIISYMPLLSQFYIEYYHANCSSILMNFNNLMGLKGIFIKCVEHLFLFVM